MEKLAGAGTIRIPAAPHSGTVELPADSSAARSSSESFNCLSLIN